MKVLWVFSHPAPYKIDFFNELGKSIDLTVLFERKTESDRPFAFYYSKAENFKCKFIHSIKIGSSNNYSSEIRNEIIKNKYDIIVINGWSTFSEMKALRYLHAHKIPYVFAINGGIANINESKLRRKLKDKYIGGAALYLAPDNHSAQYLAYYGAEVTKIKYFPYSTIYSNEIPSQCPTAKERVSLKEREGLPNKEIFISVGSFVPRKNEMMLLKIWTKVNPQKVLLLIGEGGEEENYRKFIKENNLGNVFIKPFVQHREILKFFRLSEASIFLTKEDIYGHVVNESLSQGTPVIASDNSNSALKLIQNGVNGFVFNLDEVDKIINTIDGEVPDQMRQEALKTAQDNTVEKMAVKHLEIFADFFKK
jgi:glycosyltransferase involved in cell wall biosynthesis